MNTDKDSLYKINKHFSSPTKKIFPRIRGNKLETVAIVKEVLVLQIIVGILTTENKVYKATNKIIECYEDIRIQNKIQTLQYKNNWKIPKNQEKIYCLIKMFGSQSCCSELVPERETLFKFLLWWL